MRRIRAGEGRRLNLVGRLSLEIFGGETGAQGVTLRQVDIPPESDTPRAAHRHRGCEEVIYVLAGTGRTEGPQGALEIRVGDALLVSAGEPHVTRNGGSVPLRLLCFFPTADVAAQTEEPVRDGDARTERG